MSGNTEKCQLESRLDVRCDGLRQTRIAEQSAQDVECVHTGTERDGGQRSLLLLLWRGATRDGEQRADGVLEVRPPIAKQRLGG